jgi:hypothetical protein
VRERKELLTPAISLFFTQTHLQYLLLYSVPDGFTLNIGTLASPVTLYTGRSAAAYGLVPDHEGEDKEDDATTLVSQKKKGKENSAECYSTPKPPPILSPTHSNLVDK